MILLCHRGRHGCAFLADGPNQNGFVEIGPEFLEHAIEQRAHGFCRPRTFGWAFGQQLEDQLFQRLRWLRFDLAERLRFGVDMLREDFGRRTIIGRLVRTAFVEDHAERVQIGAVIGRLACGLFGSHVPHRTDRRTFARQALVVIHPAAQSEVRQFHFAGS